MIDKKVCPGCSIEKPATDFSPSPRRTDGFAYYCRPCGARAAREYRERIDSPEVRAKNAKRQADYMRANPDQAAKDRERSAKWHKANLVAATAASTARRKANPEKEKLYQAKYRAANPEVGAAHVQRRRAQKLATVNDFTAADWRDRLAEFGNACAYCLSAGVPLQMDHVQPLSRGGHHTKENIVPACKECNLAKGSRLLIQWVGR